MRDREYYQFTKPPKALLQARPDNIAIVPASMLPFKKTLQELINKLPQGVVFLCHAEENTRQRKLLERVEETFKQQGHVVRSLSVEQVYKNTPNV
jgi:peptidase E